MRLTLPGLASQYIHMPLAPFCLKKAVEEQLSVPVTICDININEPVEDSLARLLQGNPTHIGFSVYIWNREMTARLVRRIKALDENICILLGGPEVTFSPEATFAEMPCTMIRLNLVKGLGPVLQIAEGWTVNLPEDVNDKLMERTNPTWPCTWFAPRCDGKDGSPFKTAYEVMMNWGANHGAISYGHIGADLITMCSMMRIPVCMHNVPEEDIYRPACWNAFGMDKEGQDYRACATYGPLYKK